MVPAVHTALRNRIMRITKNSTEAEFADLAAELNALSVAELAHLMGRLKNRRRAIVYRLLEKDIALEVFEAISPASRSDLLTALQDTDTVEIFRGLDPEDRVELLDELPAKVASRVLKGLDVDERDETAELLGYPEDSVGRRMSPRFVQLYPWLTVEEAMQRVHDQLSSAESVYYLPVVD